jgi:hypothetical protein
VVAINLQFPVFTAVGLTAGLYYEFKVESRSSYGYSLPSQAFTMLCAAPPEAPTSLSTANNNDLVDFAWTAAISNGSPVTAHLYYIALSDETTFLQLDGQCEGSVASNACSVSLDVLKSDPFSLVKGDRVLLKIVAVNFYG